MLLAFIKNLWRKFWQPSQPVEPIRHVISISSEESVESEGEESDETLIEIDKRLQPNQWFGTAIVNTYMNLICQFNRQKNVAAILCGEFYIPDFFKRLATGKKKYRTNYQNLIKADIILWPVERGHHWYLILIHKNEKGFYIQTVDGFNGSSHDFLWQKAEELLACLHPNDDRPRMMQRWLVPEQKNASDCGSVICYWAKQYCEGGPQTTCDYTDFRKEIADQLAKVPKDLLSNYGRPIVATAQTRVSTYKASI